MANCFSPFLAQRPIVLTRAALVGIALDQHVALRVGAQVSRMGLQQRLIATLYGIAIEVEVHTALCQRAVRIVQRIDRDLGNRIRIRLCPDRTCC
jgi:hypothetical protein